MAFMKQEKKKRLAPKIKEILKKYNMMTDYFDVGWYISVNLGKWDKPYVVNA